MIGFEGKIDKTWNWKGKYMKEPKLQIRCLGSEDWKLTLNSEKLLYSSCTYFFLNYESE